MSEVRIIHCHSCGGDGGHLDVTGRDWHGPVFDWFECRACGGWGEIEVEVFPIELEDLEAA